RDGFLSPRLRRRAPRSRRKRILRRPAPGLRVLLLGAPPKTRLRRILRRRLLARTKRTAPLRTYGRAALKDLNGLGITPAALAPSKARASAPPPQTVTPKTRSRPPGHPAGSSPPDQPSPQPPGTAPRSYQENRSAPSVRTSRPPGPQRSRHHPRRDGVAEVR